jgi:septal ring factor EnvC (AmiA/AmiB activator)
VRAVFSGRVDYSGKLKGYGEVVIIGHGSRYFSISAHLSERSKEEEELVKGGDVIGWVRAKKESGRPWLYFEMREGEKHLDVLQWLQPPQQAEQ